MHYKRQWRHKDPLKTLTPERGFERIQCIAVEHCDRDSEHACGLCNLHYTMQSNYGRTYRIVRRGESYIDSSGYVRMTVNGKMTFEHVHLAEKALGRPLPECVIVHHMNRDPSDNYTPYNLVVCPDQAYHLLIHRLMKEAGL